MTENFRTYSPLEFDLLDEKQSPTIYVEGGEIAHRLTLSIWNRDEKGRTIVLNNPDKDAREKQSRLKNIAVFADLLTLSMSERKATIKTLSEPSRAKVNKAFKGLPSGYDADTVYQMDLHEFFRHNHHFEVRFPPGLLSPKTIAWAESQLVRLLARDASEDADAWYLYCQEDPDDHSGILYLLSTAERADLDPQDSASLAPDLRIVLPHLAALPDADGQVIPVEIRPGPLTRRKDDPAPLGPRVRLIEVKSQLGKRFIPLHFAVVGADQLINDGQTETFLLLRLTNIDREERIAIDRVGNLQTVFSLSCELTQPGVERDGALSDEPAKVKLWVNKAQASGTTPPDPDDPYKWPDDPLNARSDGIRMTWEFDGHHIDTDSFGPDDSIYIRLAVTTGMRTGPSDLVLTYRHIPNYWDGSRTCKVTKSPLIYDRMSSSKENRVGIGVPHPASKLSVTDGVSIGKKFASQVTAPPDGLAVEGQVGIGIAKPTSESMMLHVKGGGMKVEGGRLEITQYDASPGIEIGNGINTNFLFTEDKTGHLHISTDSPYYDLLLQQNYGKVGIGMSKPDHPLHVDGRIKGTLHGEDLINQSVDLAKLTAAVQEALCPVGTILSYAGDKAPPGWLMCSNNAEVVDSYKGYDPSAYPDLFAVIGYRFGGFTSNKIHYFHVPDLRGRFLRGRDGGINRDPDRLSRKPMRTERDGTAGDGVGSVQDDAVGPHRHTLYGPVYSGNRSDRTTKGGNLGASTGKGERLKGVYSEIEESSVNNAETRPANMYVNFIIKY